MYNSKQYHNCNTNSFYRKSYCEYALTGDLNEDCRVGFGDTNIMFANWLEDDVAIDIEPPSKDGIVDFRDFAALAENWLIDCALTPGNPACVPK